MLYSIHCFMDRRRHVLKSLSRKQKRKFLRVLWRERVLWVSMLEIQSKTLEISWLLIPLPILTRRGFFFDLTLLYCSSNSVKDYINIAGPYGVTHIILFNKGKTLPRMRIGCFPQGPTLHFRVFCDDDLLICRLKSIH